MTKKDSIKGISSRWYKLSLYIAMAGVGLALCLYGNSQKNPVIIAIGFLILLGGILLIFTSQNELGSRILPGRKRLEKPANAIVMYPGEIEFDYIKKPPGSQQRCINDGKWYSVLIGKPKGKLQEFLLPDDTIKERHYDPREFANPVTMPANKKLFEPRPSMAKTIAVGIMGLAVCVLGIVIIAMSG